MVSDGKDLLYIGTDPDGLVYRVNRKTRESFVLYDCNESEVSALALDRHGNLYAGTAEASQTDSSTERFDSAASKDKTGRPEGSAGGVPIEAKPPTNPAPPRPKPNPNPGEPAPIPKKLMMMADDPARHRQNPVHRARRQARHPPGPAAAGDQRQRNRPTQGRRQRDLQNCASDGFVTEIFRQPALIFSPSSCSRRFADRRHRQRRRRVPAQPRGRGNLGRGQARCETNHLFAADHQRPGNARHRQHRRAGRDVGRFRDPRHVH